MLNIRNFSKLKGIYFKNSSKLTRLISSTRIIQSNEKEVNISTQVNVPNTTNTNTNTIATTTTTNTDITAAVTPETIIIPEVIVDKLPELGYSPPDLICKAIDGFHTLTSLPYWQTIIIGTIFVRICLLPSAILSQRMTSRITYVKTEVEKLNKLIELNPQKKSIYDQETAYLYKKHKINPFGGFVNPIIQLPIFISTFFALRKIGTYIPEFSTGGAFWFTDLASSDPMYILPVVNALTLLAVTEIGIQNIDMSSSPWFRPVVRGMSVISVPLTMYFPTGLLLFWVTNNTFSVAQSVTLKTPSVMKYLDIYPPPVRPPTLKITKNSFTNIFNAITGNKTNTVEYIDGDNRKTINPSTESYNPLKKREAGSTTVVKDAQPKSSFSPEVSNEPPPKTFVSPPKKKVKQKL